MPTVRQACQWCGKRYRLKRLAMHVDSCAAKSPPVPTLQFDPEYIDRGRHPERPWK